MTFILVYAITHLAFPSPIWPGNLFAGQGVKGKSSFLLSFTILPAKLVPVVTIVFRCSAS